MKCSHCRKESPNTDGDCWNCGHKLVLEPDGGVREQRLAMHADCKPDVKQMRWAVVAEMPGGEVIVAPGRYEGKAAAELCAMICVERYKRKFSVAEVGADESSEDAMQRLACVHSRAGQRLAGRNLNLKHRLYDY